VCTYIYMICTYNSERTNVRTYSYSSTYGRKFFKCVYIDWKDRLLYLRPFLTTSVLGPILIRIYINNCNCTSGHFFLSPSGRDKYVFNPVILLFVQIRLTTDNLP